MLGLGLGRQRKYNRLNTLSVRERHSGEISGANNAQAAVFQNSPKNGHSADTNENPQARAKRGFV
jgi:hypothetical protein